MSQFQKEIEIYGLPLQVLYTHEMTFFSKKLNIHKIHLRGYDISSIIGINEKKEIERVLYDASKKH